MRDDRTLHSIIPMSVLILSIMVGASFDENNNRLKTAINRALNRVLPTESGLDLESGGAKTVDGADSKEGEPKIESDLDLKAVVALLTAGSIVVISGGFAIGMVKVILLRLLSFVLRLLSFVLRSSLCGRKAISRVRRWILFVINLFPASWDLEAPVDKQTFERIWKEYFKIFGEPQDSEKLVTLVLYQRRVFREDGQKWLGRRWNAFTTSTNCIVALLFAHLLPLTKPLSGIAQTRPWVLATIVTIVMLTLYAAFAWIDILRMTRLMSRCPNLPRDGHDSRSNLIVMPKQRRAMGTHRR